MAIDPVGWDRDQIRNQQVGGSIPLAGSKSHFRNMVIVLRAKSKKLGGHREIQVVRMSGGFFDSRDPRTTP